MTLKRAKPFMTDDGRNSPALRRGSLEGLSTLVVYPNKFSKIAIFPHQKMACSLGSVLVSIFVT